MQIKNNIWKKKTSSETLFIKRYDNLALAEKVKSIHHQLESIQFPYVIPLKKTREEDLLVQVWQPNSMSADFSKSSHRHQAVQILRALHETKKNINWKNQATLPRQNFYNKWTMRLEKFLLHEKELVYYLDYGYYDIVLYASRILKKMRKQRSQGNEPLTLLHGDVVHHNFLVSKEGHMKIIDFDLAVVGDAAEEMVLWMHRALPMVNYDVSKLLHEQDYLQELCLNKIEYLQYPNELLREWLYILQLGDYERELFLDYLMPFTEKALRHWPDLVAETEKIENISN